MRSFYLVVALSLAASCSFSGKIEPNFQCSSDCDQTQTNCHDECTTSCVDAGGNPDQACDTDCRTACDKTWDDCNVSCTPAS